MKNTIMNKSTLVGLALAVAIATTVAGVAGFSTRDKFDDSAETAQQNCYEVEVDHASEPGDEKRIAGTIAGALIGGAFGKDIGDRDLTMAAGAAVGVIAGNKAQEAYQENRTTKATERRCNPAR